MLRFNKKDNKSKVVFIVAIVVIVLIIIGISVTSSSNGGLFSSIAGSFNKTFSSSAKSTTNIFRSFKSKKKLVEKISKLEKENAKLKLNNIEMKKLETENNTLRKKLEIKEEYKYFKMVVGEVILRNQSNWNESFMINVGAKDGIKVGMSVIGKDGVVGQIISVDNSTSKVLTVLDSSSSISVEISSISQAAVCKGEYSLKGANKLKLIYIPIDAEISPGDVVYTSGISEIYPKGLPVGKIIDVKNSKNQINRYAIVETFSDIMAINEIAVIIE
ncbi:MAG: rod shape-determining protein MreC [Clostridia bacterium]